MIDMISLNIYRAQYNRGEITLDEFKERVDSESRVNQAIHDAHMSKLEQWLTEYAGGVVREGDPPKSITFKATRGTVPWNIEGEGEVKS